MKRVTSIIAFFLITISIYSQMVSFISTERNSSLIPSTNMLSFPFTTTSAKSSLSIPMQAVEAKWYDKYLLVAHALGSINGIIGTNSSEAFIESYKKGYRVFECDFSITSDSKLVLRHDFDDNSYYNLEQIKDPNNMIMDYNTFMNYKINCLYTPLDVDGLVKLLIEYPDTFLITDTKYTDADNVSLGFNLLSKAITDSGHTELFERIIVQIYNQEMFSMVKEIYDFNNWIYTLYQLPIKDYDAIGKFCLSNNIDVVAIDYTIQSKKTNDILHNYGVKVFYHTPNRLSQIKAMIASGADGFYTDIILPENLMEINK